MEKNRKSTLASLSPGNVFTNEVILVPLAAYLDGANTDGRAMTLTCLAATEEIWPAIEDKWLQAKTSHGDPEYIHMTDLMALQGIYRGWSEDQRNELVWALIEALSSFMDHPQVHSFTCRVHLDDHEKWKHKNNLPAPARLCARIVFPWIVDWFYRPQNSTFVDVMDIFFDRGESFMKHIRADWQSKKIRKQYPIWNLVRVIEEVDMTVTPPMQMADMICWGFHRQGTYTHPEPWLVDDNEYTIAVRAANCIRGPYTILREQQLRYGRFKEEGQALIELWNKKAALVPNPSEEYKKFERMMRRLEHGPEKKK